ncbi:MAG: hypothetical protein DRJ98_00895 [Thermoprotei archaeon]|nr:MAG: hypothetical protein DRJ98_00895 [Thermoprotei archaeon]RLF18876.1 MAG: hypothetical protein DRN06_00015 [Thermoprotei archaeon]
MKLYIAACGLGLGHATRCLALAEKAKMQGFKVAFSTYSGETLKLLRNKGYPVLEVPYMAYLLGDDGNVDFKLTLARGPIELRKLAVQTGLEFKYMLKEKPDVVVADSRLSAVTAAYLLDLPSILILNQVKLIIPRRRPIKGAALKVKAATERLGCELLGMGWSKVDKVLVADFPPPYTISRDNLYVPARLRGKLKLVGPLIDYERYTLEDKDQAKEKLKLYGKPLILVSTGGLKEERIKLLRTVISSFKGLSKVNVVVSASLPERQGLMFEENGVKVYGWLPSRHEYLKAADLLITHGGHTSIAEAMYTATPMLIVPNKGHTERTGNARAAEQLGVAKVLDQEEAEAEKLREVALTMLSDPTYSERASKLAKEVHRFRAVDEALKEILNLIGNQ